VDLSVVRVTGRPLAAGIDHEMRCLTQPGNRVHWVQVLPAEAAQHRAELRLLPPVNQQVDLRLPHDPARTERLIRGRQALLRQRVVHIDRKSRSRT
jgi:hypothetical protein